MWISMMNLVIVAINNLIVGAIWYVIGKKCGFIEGWELKTRDQAEWIAYCERKDRQWAEQGVYSSQDDE